MTPITLNHLTRKQVAIMVGRMTDGAVLPDEVLRQVVAKTDGVPLFVEELTKMVLESDLLRERENHYEMTGLSHPLAIPATLQDSLMARLDRLGTAKEVAQLGATLRREFSYELLHAVSQLDETTLQKELARLVDAELLDQRGPLMRVERRTFLSTPSSRRPPTNRCSNARDNSTISGSPRYWQSNFQIPLKPSPNCLPIITRRLISTTPPLFTGNGQTREPSAARPM